MDACFCKLQCTIDWETFGCRNFHSVDVFMLIFVVDEIFFSNNENFLISSMLTSVTRFLRGACNKGLTLH